MLSQRAIIAAGGKGKRWNNYLGVPKHLIKIRNETWIDRQVRLLKENGIEDIYSVLNNEKYKIKGVNFYKAINSDYEIDKICSYKDIWKSEMIILYGDVFFTKKAMKTIIDSRVNDILFFGRKGKSSKTGGRWGEIFAFKVKNIKLLEKSCDFIKKSFISGKIKRCKTWEIYRHIENIPLNKHIIRGRFIEINDITEDFDDAIDYNNWIRLNE